MFWFLPDVLSSRLVTVKFVQDTSKFWYKPDISRDQGMAAASPAPDIITTEKPKVMLSSEKSGTGFNGWVVVPSRSYLCAEGPGGRLLHRKGQPLLQRGLRAGHEGGHAPTLRPTAESERYSSYTHNRCPSDLYLLLRTSQKRIIEINPLKGQ